MKKHFRPALVILLSFLGVITGSLHIYDKEKLSIQAQMDNIFFETIKKDLDNRSGNALNALTHYRVKGTKSNETKIETGDSCIVTKKDKHYNSQTDLDKIVIQVQNILSGTNPLDVDVFNSLFSNALQQQNIQFQTGVKYYNSKTDSTYYSQSAKRIYKCQFTPEIILGNNPHMTIQGFYAVPFSFALSNSTLEFVILFIAIFCMCILLLLFLNRLKRNSIIDKIRGMAFVEEEEIENTVKITDTVFYNHSKQTVISPKGKIVLSEQPNTLLHTFIKSPGFFLSYQQIDELFWPKRENSRTNRSQLISRLKNELSSIPEIEIKNETRIGYRLVIHHEGNMDRQE